jgi:hypothetical protein
MTTLSPVFDLALISAAREREELIRDVQAGLHSRPALAQAVDASMTSWVRNCSNALQHCQNTIRRALNVHCLKSMPMR